MSTIYFDVHDAVRGLRMLKERGPRIAARAINKSVTSVRAVAAREIASEVGLRVGEVKDELFVREATAANPIAEIRIRGRRLPLIRFGARGPEPSRGKGHGVTYRIGRGGRGRVREAFIAKMATGHRGVFRRTGKGRLPIIELHGPSLPFVFAKEAIMQAMQRRYEEAMFKNLPHEVEFELRRIGARSS